MAFPIETFLTENFSNMLVTLIIPFLIIFSVLLWAFKLTKLFSGLISAILSLGLTIMIYAINPGNIFQFLASYLFQIGVAGTIITLGGVTLLIFWALIRRGVSIAEKLKGDEQKLKDLEKKEKKLWDEYYGRGFRILGPSTGKRMQISEELERIEKEKKYLLAKLKRIHV